jgi:hypothetical protein
MLATNILTASEVENSKRAFASDGCFVLRNVVSAARLTEIAQNIHSEFDAASKSGALFSGGGLSERPSQLFS